MQSKQPDKMYNCIYCDTKFSNCYLYKVHNKKHKHSKGYFLCPICTHKTIPLHQMGVHEARHRSEDLEHLSVCCAKQGMCK